MCYTDDPIRDFHRYDREREAELESLPKCSECGNAIQDEYCYEINGEYICEDCLNYYHRKRTEDVI
jgi:formylmethanofuran dehydrogenase subunit E